MHVHHTKVWNASAALAAASVLATTFALDPRRLDSSADPVALEAAPTSVVAAIAHPSGVTAGAELVTATIDASVITSSSATMSTDVDEPRTVASDSAPQAPRPVVVLYGDSLAWEAQPFFLWATSTGSADLSVHARTFGGTAICDYLDAMRADAAAVMPGVVVVEFSGNSMTECMLDPSGEPLIGQAYLDRYRADAEAVVDIFEPIGAHVIFAGAPIAGVPEIDEHTSRIRQIYELVALEHVGVTFVDAGAAVLHEGEWTRTLPCLVGEPCTGGTDPTGTAVNVVRSPDGVHFCPVGRDAIAGQTTECPVWASGAFRFAMAMAAPVLERLAGGERGRSAQSPELETAVSSIVGSPLHADDARGVSGRSTPRPSSFRHLPDVGCAGPGDGVAGPAPRECPTDQGFRGFPHGA